jgi:hypothetical protein
VGWWSNITFIDSEDGGGFQRGSARHVDRVSTHHVVDTYQGTMSSLRLSVGKFLPSPIQSVVQDYSVDEVFFPFRFTVFVTAHTLIHLRPGPSGVTGFLGSLFDLMRQTLGC